MKRARIPSSKKKKSPHPLWKLAGSAPSKQRVKCIIDPTTGMNRTETRYAGYLAQQCLTKEIIEWKFEPIRLRIADGTFYTPDFAVLLSDSTLELHDVKGRSGRGAGGWEDASLVRIKVAADLYPWFKFVGVVPTKDGWERTEF